VQTADLGGDRGKCWSVDGVRLSAVRGFAPSHSERTGGADDLDHERSTMVSLVEDKFTLSAAPVANGVLPPNPESEMAA
jgi:hypothetical protein